MGTPSTAAEVRGSPGLGHVLRDTRFVFWREMLLPLRDPFSLIFSLIQPLVFLGLFSPLVGAAVGAPAFGGQSTLQWFLPGVVVMMALFGTSMTGSNLQYELTTGSYERILATPPSRSSLMIGPEGVGAAGGSGAAVRRGLHPVRFCLLPAARPVRTGDPGDLRDRLGALSYALALVSQNKE
jgi:ABC-2 type transport system permease protein